MNIQHMRGKSDSITGVSRQTQIFTDTNDIPAFIPTRTREIAIISKDLAALLVTAKSAPVMRKMLFNNRHFFLGKEKKDKLIDC